ncbi:MAG: hypothetical protein PHT94_01055 [Candidatus Nanoarchaeia archaeon]|nr:hypothetical protein [Candidatus Nanoarchaeia archaeon]
MSSKASTSSGGIGFCGLLTIVFITLKLLDKIDWSWWWVLSPIWIPFSIVISLVIIYFIVLFADALIKDYRRKKSRKIN